MKASALHSLFISAALLMVSSPSWAAKDIPYLRFLNAFNEGANCPRLFELLNEAKRQGATKDAQKLMNEKLRAVGCFTDTSKRLR